VEGAVIGLLLIASGLGFAWLAHAKFKDRRRGAREFRQYEEDSLDRWWKLNAKLRRFNAHLDLWMFAILAPLCVVAGVVVLVRGE